jgi:hypothetical protein
MASKAVLIMMGQLIWFTSLLHFDFKGLGYFVTCPPNGGIIVEGTNGKQVDCKEFVSFSSHCHAWKKDYPQLKVSCLEEDISQY